MIEIYGLDNFIKYSKSRKLHEDSYGILYIREIQNDEPVLAVQVRNATAEPDGTYKSYFIRVPPTMKTAKEAVAWTFGMNHEDYRPKKET